MDGLDVSLLEQWFVLARVMLPLSGCLQQREGTGLGSSMYNIHLYTIDQKATINFPDTEQEKVLLCLYFDVFF